LAYLFYFKINKASLLILVRKEYLEPDEEGGDGEIPQDKKRIVYASIQPGDGFIFQGRQKVHWREGTLPEGFSRVFFYHFVNEDYTGLLV
jgi:hypothetical protein